MYLRREVMQVIIEVQVQLLWHKTTRFTNGRIHRVCFIYIPVISPFSLSSFLFFLLPLIGFGPHLPYPSQQNCNIANLYVTFVNTTVVQLMIGHTPSVPPSPGPVRLLHVILVYTSHISVNYFLKLFFVNKNLNLKFLFTKRKCQIVQINWDRRSKHIT